MGAFIYHHLLFDRLTTRPMKMAAFLDLHLHWILWALGWLTIWPTKMVASPNLHLLHWTLRALGRRRWLCPWTFIFFVGLFEPLVDEDGCIHRPLSLSSNSPSSWSTNYSVDEDGCIHRSPSSPSNSSSLRSTNNLVDEDGCVPESSSPSSNFSSP